MTTDQTTCFGTWNNKTKARLPASIRVRKQKERTSGIGEKVREARKECVEKALRTRARGAKNERLEKWKAKVNC